MYSKLRNTSSSFYMQAPEIEKMFVWLLPEPLTAERELSQPWMFQVSVVATAPVPESRASFS